MASEPSEVELAAESAKKLWIDIPDIYRGFNYTVEEISVISGAPLVPLARILDAKSSWSGWTLRNCRTWSSRSRMASSKYPA